METTERVDNFKSFEVLNKNSRDRIANAIELSVNVAQRLKGVQSTAQKVATPAFGSGVTNVYVEAATSKFLLGNWNSKLGDGFTEAELLEKNLPKHVDGKKLGGITIGGSKYLIFSPEELEHKKTYAISEEALKAIYLKCGGDKNKANTLFPSLELISKSENLAQEWKLKIKDWNLIAPLPAQTPLPDGKSVPTSKAQRFSDLGTNFGQLGEVRFRMAITDVKKAHKNANILAVFPTEKGDIVWYLFKSEMNGVDSQNRGGVYDSSAYFLFDKGDGQKFIDHVQAEPSLADALVAAEFPVFKAEVKVQVWNELLYLPQDLSIPTIKDQIKILAAKQGD